MEVEVCSRLVNEVGYDYERLVKGRFGDRLDWFVLNWAFHRYFLVNLMLLGKVRLG